MGADAILGILKESIFFLAIFGTFFAVAVVRGVQTITNLILALYLGLLIALEFPYFDLFFNGNETKRDAIVMIVLFSIFSAAGFFLFRHLMPTDYREPPMRGLGKKLFLSAMATVLVMTYSYNVLPVTDLITPGSPIQALFAPENRFFFWLIVPLIGLYFV